MTNSEKPTESVSVEPVTSHALAEKSSTEIVDELYEDKLRTKAQVHFEDAIDKLATIMKSGKSESVQRLCANDLIEHGHKRKNVDPLAGILDDGKLNIQVNLITFAASAHGRETKAVASHVVDELPAQLDQEDVIDVEPSEPVPEVVLTNPGDK